MYRNMLIDCENQCVIIRYSRVKNILSRHVLKPHHQRLFVMMVMYLYPYSSALLSLYLLATDMAPDTVYLLIYYTLVPPKYQLQD